MHDDVLPYEAEFLPTVETMERSREGNSHGRGGSRPVSHSRAVYLRLGLFRLGVRGVLVKFRLRFGGNVFHILSGFLGKGLH